MGVDFRGEYGLVPQHLLDHAQVGSVLHEVGCEGMPEAVGGYLLAHPGEQGLASDHVEHGDAAQRLPEAVEKGCVVECRGGSRRADFQVVGECGGGHLPEGHQPLLVAFSYHPHEVLVQIDGGDAQRAQFGDPQAATVENLKNRPVAQPCPAVAAHRGDDVSDFLHREHFGQVAAELGGVDAVAGVVLPVALVHHPVEERFEGAEHPGLRAAGQFSGDSCKPGRQLAGADVARRGLRRLQQLAHVGAVRGDRVGRQLSLDLQVVGVVAEYLPPNVHGSAKIRRIK